MSQNSFLCKNLRMRKAAFPTSYGRLHSTKERTMDYYYGFPFTEAYITNIFHYIDGMQSLSNPIGQTRDFHGIKVTSFILYEHGRCCTILYICPYKLIKQHHCSDRIICVEGTRLGYHRHHFHIQPMMLLTHNIEFLF